MNKQISTFVDMLIKKHKFYYSKHPLDINNVDIDKIMISTKVIL